MRARRLVACRHKYRNASAFTLLEILIGIVVVFVLAALMYSLFPNAVLTAKLAGSASNLRRIGTALIQHTYDYNGLLPLSICFTGVDSDGARLGWGSYGAGGNYEGGHIRWYEVLNNFYIEDKSIFLDPSNPGVGWKTRSDGGTANNDTFPYGYNRNLHSSLSTDPDSHDGPGAFPEGAINVNDESKLPNYPRVVAVAQGYSYHRVLRSGFSTAFRVNDVRNNGLANVLFLDGSVKLVDRKGHKKSDPEPLNFK